MGEKAKTRNIKEAFWPGQLNIIEVQSTSNAAQPAQHARQLRLHFAHEALHGARAQLVVSQPRVLVLLRRRLLLPADAGPGEQPLQREHLLLQSDLGAMQRSLRGSQAGHVTLHCLLVQPVICHHRLQAGHVLLLLGLEHGPCRLLLCVPCLRKRAWGIVACAVAAVRLAAAEALHASGMAASNHH